MGGVEVEEEQRDTVCAEERAGTARTAKHD